ncbi:MAG: RluA family pseudouridine synthase [Clostridia bacterium]|nr:RluA family pseudouridine synthase [Clostridia bacterium]
MIFTVDENFGDIRLDKYLSEVTEFSRSYIAKLIDDDQVLVNGTSRKVSFKLDVGDTVVLEIPEAAPSEAQPENIPLEIVYEDACMLVVNKPQGMVVHPAAGNQTGTLVNALLYHCGDSLSGIGGVARPGILHRIDKDTSGLLLVAKTDKAHISLAAQIKEHSLSRKYNALVHGHFKEPEGKVEGPIGRSPKDRKKMCINYDNGRDAVTHYKVLKEFEKYTLVECRLETGRTHQIRVHMSSIGHPVACDPVYGVKKEPLSWDGQLLHAKTVGFIHPLSGEYREFSAPLPDYFEKIINKLKGR